MPKLPDISQEDSKRLQKDFVYHSPKGDQPSLYVLIRSAGGSFASLVFQATPKSREQSLAITKIEEAIFWANAAIARNE